MVKKDKKPKSKSKSDKKDKQSKTDKKSKNDKQDKKSAQKKQRQQQTPLTPLSQMNYKYFSNPLYAGPVEVHVYSSQPMAYYSTPILPPPLQPFRESTAFVKIDRSTFPKHGVLPWPKSVTTEALKQIRKGDLIEFQKYPRK